MADKNSPLNCWNLLTRNGEDNQQRSSRNTERSTTRAAITLVASSEAKWGKPEQVKLKVKI